MLQKQGLDSDHDQLNGELYNNVDSIQSHNKQNNQQSSQQKLYDIQKKWVCHQQFEIHGKQVIPRDFPFHLYLKQHYKRVRLSLQQQLRICSVYFNSNLKQFQQIEVDPAHIQILNENLNIFTKVPSNPLLFLLIYALDQQKEVSVAKNYNGEIIHFQTFSNKKKRATMLTEISRRIKGRSFIVIYDKTQSAIQQLTQNFFKKLARHFKFLYIVSIPNQMELLTFNCQFFSQKDFNFKTFGSKRKINVAIDKNSNQLFAYCSTLDEIVTQTKLYELKNEYFSHFQALIREQTNLVQGSKTVEDIFQNNITINKKFKCNLLLMNAMLINFIKSTKKTKQNFLNIVQKMLKQYEISNQELIGSERDHFPEKILNSRRCKYCQLVCKDKNKKSKYKCVGCSKRFSMDVPLCIGCWGSFHDTFSDVINKKDGPLLKDLRRIYQNQPNNRYNNSQIYKQNVKKVRSNQSNEDQMAQLIVKLDSNVADMQAVMDSMVEQQIEQIKSAKIFNQTLFVGLLQCMNKIIKYNVSPHNRQEQKSQNNQQIKNEVNIFDGNNENGFDSL